jgi:hypothetical protein
MRNRRENHGYWRDDIGQQWFQGEDKVQNKLNEFKVQGLITYKDENFNHPSSTQVIKILKFTTQPIRV